jgi:hypothetical protein
MRTCSSTGWRTCRCGRWRRRSAPARGCCCSCSAPWEWLAAPEHRGLLTLWTEAYARSLAQPDGPWGDFARATVEDWLALLDGDTGALAVLRGGMLDLLATGDEPRVTAAVRERLLAG